MAPETLDRFALCFILYAIVSFLGTLLTQAIVHKQSLRAWPIEFIQTIILLFVIEEVVNHPNAWVKIMVAAGGATGTLLAIEWRKRKEKRHGQ